MPYEGLVTCASDDDENAEQKPHYLYLLNEDDIFTSVRSWQNVDCSSESESEGQTILMLNLIYTEAAMDEIRRKKSLHDKDAFDHKFLVHSEAQYPLIRFMVIRFDGFLLEEGKIVRFKNEYIHELGKYEFESAKSLCDNFNTICKQDTPLRSVQKCRFIKFYPQNKQLKAVVELDSDLAEEDLQAVEFYRLIEKVSSGKIFSIQDLHVSCIVASKLSNHHGLTISLIVASLLVLVPVEPRHPGQLSPLKLEKNGTIRKMGILKSTEFVRAMNDESRQYKIIDVNMRSNKENLVCDLPAESKLMKHLRNQYRDVFLLMLEVEAYVTKSCIPQKVENFDPQTYLKREEVKQLINTIQKKIEEINDVKLHDVPKIYYPYRKGKVVVVVVQCYVETKAFTTKQLTNRIRRSLQAENGCNGLAPIGLNLTGS
ncbi:unnamed protein product [Echinostoma caproni]|uniref:Inositol-pentakisphosphate 2-kinase n=1 Tax=Echinostoma caproni TaxID=27848 RepID=A0A183AD46_9TREM|nr:unnamed protein product [Echinostoma caproni]